MTGSPQPIDTAAIVKEVEAAAIATETAEPPKEEPAPVPQIIEPAGAPIDQKEEVSTVKADAAAEGEKAEDAAKAEEGTSATAASGTPSKKEKKPFSIGGLFKGKSPKVSLLLLHITSQSEADASVTVSQGGEEGERSCQGRGTCHSSSPSERLSLTILFWPRLLLLLKLLPRPLRRASRQRLRLPLRLSLRLSLSLSPRLHLLRSTLPKRRLLPPPKRSRLAVQRRRASSTSG